MSDYIYPHHHEYRLTVVRTRGGGRGLEHSRGYVVEISRAVRRQLALLPLGSVVKTQCLQIDTDTYTVKAQSISEIERPAAVIKAISLWDEGKPRSAFAALMAEGAELVEDDPYRLGWRIRLELDLEQEQEALQDFRRLLALDDKLDVGERPPGLLSLFGSLSPALHREMAPELVRRVSRFNYQSPEVGRLLDMIQVELWPTGYLSYRLKTDLSGSGAKIREREAQRRLSELELPEADRGRMEQALQRAAQRRAELQERELQRRSQRALVHHVLRKALHLVPREERPAPPFHAGGPPPRLNADQNAELGRWITGETQRRTRRSPRRRAGADTIKTLVGSAMELLMEEQPEEEVRAFLLELDQVMMRLELVARIERALPSPAAVEASRQLEQVVPRVLYRGVDERGHVQAWLLGVGRGHGLFCQVKGAWIWVEGTFDEVVASMPDHWFEGAAMVMEG
jgi:hypothetical protein